MATSIRRKPRCLSSLTDDHWLNARNGTGENEPVVVTVDAPRKRRRRDNDIADDTTRPMDIVDVDVTVARLLGSATKDPTEVPNPEVTNAVEDTLLDKSS